MPASILIVDDESGIRESLGALLRDEGYEVEAISTGEECLQQIERRSFDLILLDVWLPQMDGLATLEAIQSSRARAGCNHDFRAWKYRDRCARDQARRF